VADWLLAENRFTHHDSRQKSPPTAPWPLAAERLRPAEQPFHRGDHDHCQPLRPSGIAWPFGIALWGRRFSSTLGHRGCCRAAAALLPPVGQGWAQPLADPSCQSLRRLDSPPPAKLMESSAWVLLILNGKALPKQGPTRALACLYGCPNMPTAGGTGCWSSSRGRPAVLSRCLDHKAVVDRRIRSL